MKSNINNLFFLITSGLFLSSCNKLDEIEYSPKISPEDFQNSQHWINVKIGSLDFIWSQPTSTLIVYFVGLFTIYVGYRFWSNAQNHKSRYWWAIGLGLTGLGALFAGTSYQALGFELKCKGRDFCTYTSWWEIAYMALSVPGMNAFLAAATYSNAKGVFRKVIIIYAIANTIIYSTILAYGIMQANQMLVSFEFMSLISAPSVLFLVGLHAVSSIRFRNTMNYNLLKVWLLFIGVGVAYGFWLSMSLTQSLWSQEIWFSENDVLHVGLIFWVYYILKSLPEEVKDIE